MLLIENKQTRHVVYLADQLQRYGYVSRYILIQKLKLAKNSRNLLFNHLLNYEIFGCIRNYSIASTHRSNIGGDQIYFSEYLFKLLLITTHPNFRSSDGTATVCV